MNSTVGATGTAGPAGRNRMRRLAGLASAAVLALVLAACQADEMSYGGYGPKELRPVSRSTQAEMAKLGLSSSSPVLMRIFKEENKFEVWKQDRSGRYVLLKSYDICKWSGKLGPKVREGDRQAPEGFYPITPGLLNPNSDWYLAFNTGFPNAYDRANGRTGSALMVHGSCSSRGCYAMTDPQIQEIYALARDAFKGGQKYFQLQAFPFRLTAENLARHWDDPNIAFWKMLKEGYDTFELTRMEPKVDVCGRQYVFNANPDSPLNAAMPCPDLKQPAALKASLMAKAREDETRATQLYAALVEKKKAEEERQVQIAMAAEEAKRKAEERRIAAAQNPGLFNTLFASAGAGDSAEMVATGPVVVPPGGAPMPAADPRGPELHAIALAEVEQPAASRPSAFTRLFSFGFDKSEDNVLNPVPATTPATTAAIAPAAGATPAPQAGPTLARAAAQTPAPQSPGQTPGQSPVQSALQTPSQPKPGLPAPVATAATATPAPACAPAGTVASPGTPVCAAPSVPPPTVAVTPAPGDEGLLKRLTSWF